MKQLSDEAKDLIHNLNDDRLIYGKMRQVSAIDNIQFKMGRHQGTYTGEVDAQGQAYGWGIFTRYDGATWEGTFVNNKLNGYCYFINYNNNLIIGEIMDNEW